MGWVKDLIDSAILSQKAVLFEFSEEKRAEAYGRAGRVIVDGPGGGMFELWFTKEEGMQWKPPEVPIRNTVYLKEETLLDMVTPSITVEDILRLSDEGKLGEVFNCWPKLDPRVARANGLILISGDASLYDAEEFADIWDRVVRKVFFPIVVRGIVRRMGRKVRR